MSWAKVASGRYERPTDGLETLTKAICQAPAAANREHWVVNSVARIKVDGATEEETFKLIQNAWVHLRFNHPAVAITSENTTLIYEVPNEPELDTWLSSSAFFEEAQTFKEFLRVVRPSKFNTIHFFPQSSQVVIRMHHWLTDGTGAVALMDKLLEYLAQNAPRPQFGEEWQRLPPSLTEVASLALTPTSAAEEVGNAMFTKFVTNLPSIGLPYNPPLQGLGGAKCERVSKDGDFGNILAARSKDIGSSVASAVNAAIAVAVGEVVVPALAKQNLTAMALFNYRPYLQAPYNDVKSWPGGCYLAVLPFTLPQADFATQAKAFYDIYRQPLRMGESTTMEGYNTFAKHMNAMVAQGLPPDAPLPSHPQFSSLGVIDRYIRSDYAGAKSVTVEDVEVLVDEMTASIILTQWSFSGRWNLNAAYNENLYEQNFVNQFLERVLEILIEGLGIKN